MCFREVGLKFDNSSTNCIRLLQINLKFYVLGLWVTKNVATNFCQYVHQILINFKNKILTLSHCARNIPPDLN